MHKETACDYLKKTFPEFDFRFDSRGRGNDRQFRIICDDVFTHEDRPIIVRLGSRAEMVARSEPEWILLLMRAVKYIERMAERGF